MHASPEDLENTVEMIVNDLVYTAVKVFERVNNLFYFYVNTREHLNRVFIYFLFV